MFEQKKTKQDEHNFVSSYIESPEVGCTSSVSPQTQNSDKKTSRTVDEIYDSLVGRIKAQYGDEVTEQEAHEAARNLLGLCNKIVEMEMERMK